MKSLLIERENNIYLDDILLQVNEKTRKIYFELITERLEEANIDYSLVLNIKCINHNKKMTKEILVNEKQFEEIKKQVYLFTKIACISDFDNLNVVDFGTIEQALEYSDELTNRYHEYHLIRKNRFDNYSIHLTFDNFDENELENEYQEKVKKLVKSN